MHSPIVAGQRARLRKAPLAEVAAERSHVVVTPVMHYQARALGELLLAATEVADEVRRSLISVLIENLDSIIGSLGHRLETSIWLRSSDIFAD